MLFFCYLIAKLGQMGGRSSAESVFASLREEKVRKAEGRKGGKAEGVPQKASLRLCARKRSERQKGGKAEGQKGGRSSAESVFASLRLCARRKVERQKGGRAEGLVS